VSVSIDYVVDTEATVEEAPCLARRVVDELCRRGVILATPQHHDFLGHGPQYATGPNVGQVADHTDCFPCGMDVVIGRTVYDAGDNGLKAVSCPSCGHRYDLGGEGWAAAIGEWANRQGPGLLNCSSCRNAAPIVTWRFDPVWGFGDLAFQFSEWFLREDFIQELSRFLGHRVTHVQSHI
jgi:hypothetical protein